MNDSDQLAAIYVPDVVPTEALSGESEFSMTAGDFLEVYGNQNG